MDFSDQHPWVVKAHDGDQQAFARLVEVYWDRIYRWLYGLTADPHTAEDLTQETFVKAWLGLSRLQDTTTFCKWLFRIAQNCFVDQYRQRKQMLPLPEAATEVDLTPLQHLLEQESQQMLQQALLAIPEHYRAAYLLWTQEEMPYSEIASILEITEETSRWRVCKARQMLLKKLKTYLDTIP